MNYSEGIICFGSVEWKLFLLVKNTNKGVVLTLRLFGLK